MRYIIMTAFSVYNMQSYYFVIGPMDRSKDIYILSIDGIICHIPT